MVAPSTPLRRSWHNGSVVVGAHPRVYLPFARWRYGRELAFGRDTQIVIEGFPRSANSFAVTAFRMSQDADVRIAHHLHQPAQVLAAASRGVPSIVLVREPTDAIVSYLIRQPHLTVQNAVCAYAGFYRPLVNREQRYVVASFEQITHDYGSVIDRVNRRFGTSFTPFQHTEENVARCFAEIERISRQKHDGRLVESAVARPSDQRVRMKAELTERFGRETSAAQIAELRALYRRFNRMTV